jgi:hypothetical protein
MTGNATAVTIVQCNPGEKAVGGGVGIFTDATLTTPVLNHPFSVDYPVNSSGNQVANGGTATGWAGANGGGLAGGNVTVISVLCAS